LEHLESVEGFRRQRTIFVSRVLSGDFKERCSNNGEIFNVCMEKVAEPDERYYHFDVGRRLHISNCLEFVLAGLDAFWWQHKAKVRDLPVAKNKLFQVYFEVAVV
jgi:hypothetical protein